MLHTHKLCVLPLEKGESDIHQKRTNKTNNHLLLTLTLLFAFILGISGEKVCIKHNILSAKNKLNMSNFTNETNFELNEFKNEPTFYLNDIQKMKNTHNDWIIVSYTDLPKFDIELKYVKKSIQDLNEICNHLCKLCFCQFAVNDMEYKLNKIQQNQFIITKEHSRKKRFLGSLAVAAVTFGAGYMISKFDAERQSILIDQMNNNQITMTDIMKNQMSIIEKNVNFTNNLQTNLLKEVYLRLTSGQLVRAKH